MAVKWNKGEPRKRTQTVTRLRFRNLKDPCLKKTEVGDFVYSTREGAWVEVGDRDGVGLYKEDGWEILAWRDLK